MTDPIADMLTRIRNALLAKKTDVQVPYSIVKHNLGKKLEQMGYIGSLQTQGEGKNKTLNITLLYKNKLPAITNIKRISKPGRRIYTRNHKIPRTLSGYGATIISTSQGILTDLEAKKAGIGGEIICQIW